MMENINPQDISSTLNTKKTSDIDTKLGTILVIDDELGPRESLRMLFKDDYHMIIADSGDAGIREVKERDPDIIILDLKMPNKGGLETLEEIRYIDEKIPVIILTGYGDMESAKKAISLSVVEFISKPFDIQDMRKIVKRVSEKRIIEKRSERLIADLNILNNNLKTRLTRLENMATIGQLSTEIIHDTNNLLTIIYGYIQILIKELDIQQLPDKQKKYVEIIEREIGKCRYVTQGILELAKAKRVIEDTDVNVVLNNVVELFKNAVMGKNTEFNLQLETIPTIKRDPQQLHQAIVNIIMNSLQSMETPGRITITTRLSDNNILISIKDTGKGMPEDMIQKITDPFVTNKAEGTGLGLTIASRVIRNHNGKLKIYSEQNKGTEVVISLPAK